MVLYASHAYNTAKYYQTRESSTIILFSRVINKQKTAFVVVTQICTLLYKYDWCRLLGRFSEGYGIYMSADIICVRGDEECG